MTATTLIQYLTWALYLSVFVATSVQAIRQPRRATLNIAFLFGICAFIIADTALSHLELYTITPLLTKINGALLLALPYVQLRLVDDFVGVKAVILRAAEVWLLLACGGLFLFASQPWWMTTFQVVYFAGLQVYAANAFARASFRATGVTRRRLAIVAFGSVFLALLIVTASLQRLHPGWGVVSQLCGLASGVCYFLGFAPPRFLRRAWQEPELRAFLGRAAHLPRLPTTAAILRQLEQGATTSLGASNAVIGLWDSATDRLHFEVEGEPLDLLPTTGYAAGKAFVEQRPLFTADAFTDSSDYADVMRHYNAKVILAAPITAGTNRLGVLSVYSARTPIFAEDDLELVRLLAEQAAVILESRALIDEAARVQAREETIRMKDDFLSSAAHDLKTPLTTIVGRAELMERRARREPGAPTDLRSLQAIIAEAQRLQTLVRELLDASRAEQGQLLGTRIPTDLAAIAHESCDAIALVNHAPIHLDASSPVVGSFDPVRLRQLLDNLLENAVKYSPHGGRIDVRVWQEDHSARLMVADRGIGIPASDLPHIFKRFYRAKNAESQQFSGMGLGLFICYTIVEQHGGRIWVQAHQPKGTEFHVGIPLVTSDAQEPAPSTVV